MMKWTVAIILIAGGLSLARAATPTFANDGTIVGGEVYGGQRFLAQRIIINNAGGALELTVTALRLKNLVLATGGGLDGNYLSKVEVIRATDGVLLGEQTSAAELGKLSTTGPDMVSISTAAHNKVGPYSTVALEIWLTLKGDPPPGTKVGLSTSVRYMPRGGTSTDSAAITALPEQQFTVGEPIGLARGGVQNMGLEDRYVYPGERFLAQRIRLVDSDADPYNVTILSFRIENVSPAGSRLADDAVARIEVIRAGDGVLMGHTTASAGLGSGGVTVSTTANNLVPDDSTMTAEIWVTLKPGSVPDGRRLRLNTVVWHAEGGQTFDVRADPPANSATFTTRVVGFEEAEAVRLVSARVSPGARFLAQELRLRDEDPNLFDVTLVSFLFRNVSSTSPLPERYVAKIEVLRKSDGALLGQTTTPTGWNDVGVRVSTTANNRAADDTEIVLQVWITLKSDAPVGRTVKLSTVVTHTEDTTTFHTERLEGPAEFTTAVNQPPAGVDFSWSPERPSWNQTISFTPSERIVDPDGEITNATFVWDFGDGSRAVSTTGPSPVSYRYGRGGTFAVKLVVIDEGGAQAEKTRSLTTTNTLPAVDFSWEPREPRWDEAVVFTPTATDPDGEIARALFEWDFGDGSPARRQTGPERIRHQFAEGGSFSVKLTVTDEAGGATSKTREVRVTPRPTLTGMDFDWSPKPVIRGGTVTFTATDPTGVERGTPTPPYTFSWDFGDQTSGTGKVVTHTYEGVGTFTVTLTVTDAAGARGRVQKTLEVAVPPAPPPTITALAVSPPTPEAGQEVRFTATATASEGDPVNRWEWDFGDGTPVQGADVSVVSFTFTHTYANPGAYTVRVRARNAQGGFSPWLTRDIYVRPKGGALIGTRLLDNPARTQARIQVFLPQGATGVKIQIFDMLGRPVLSADVVGGQYTWNLTDQAGRRIADGLYVYLVTATVAGKTERSEVGKILVVR